MGTSLRSQPWRRATRGLAAVGACLVISGCSGVLDPKGPIGDGQRTILLNSLAIMLAIVIPTIVATLAFAWWFRASNTRATYRPDFVYSGQIELVVWSIPTLVIIFLGGLIWIGSHELDPRRAPEGGGPPLEIQVVSLDWKWLFIYPEQGVASVNRLVLPVGRTAAFHITSSSVMNTFFVPQLGGMIYAMNGMTTQLHLRADHEGVYLGRSGHFSGDGFPGMHFATEAVGGEAFDGFVAEARSAGAKLDRQAYSELAKPSSDVPPRTYGDIDKSLFEAVATRAIPPGPGPNTRDYKGVAETGVAPNDLFGEQAICSAN